MSLLTTWDHLCATHFVRHCFAASSMAATIRNVEKLTSAVDESRNHGLIPADVRNVFTATLELSSYDDFVSEISCTRDSRIRRRMIRIAFKEL
jgi:hypothetical protein